MEIMDYLSDHDKNRYLRNSALVSKNKNLISELENKRKSIGLTSKGETKLLSLKRSLTKSLKKVPLNSIK